MSRTAQIILAILFAASIFGSWAYVYNTACEGTGCEADQ